MLVLSRKLGEKIVIGADITVVINDIRGNQVRLGIAAPNEVKIYREEIAPKPESVPATAEAPQDTSPT